MDLASLLRDVPDFPKPGITFKDITPLLAHPEGLAHCLDRLAESIRASGATRVVGIESRGFLFGVPVARELGLGFAPIRKPGKLPWRTVAQEYELEYGTDKIELHEDAIEPGEKVAVVDDLLATGGTASAACSLIERVGGNVAGCFFVVELSFLDGRAKLGERPVESLVHVN